MTDSTGRGRISDERLAAVRASAPLAEMVGAVVKLERSGREYQGLCPFHDERTPSFQVYAKGGIPTFHCHGCGAHGDAMDWLRLIHGMALPAAVEYLEGRAGTLPRVALPPIPAAKAVPEWVPIQPIPAKAPALILPSGKTARIRNPKQAGLDREFTALRPAHVAIYRGSGGEALGYVLRCERRDGTKFTPQITWAKPADAAAAALLPAGGDWAMVSMADPRPLYGLDRLAARPGKPVIMVMGERKADDLQALLGNGAAVMCWAGGDVGRLHADFSPLAGRQVWIWPDADRTGRAAAVGEILKAGDIRPGAAQIATDAGAASVRVLEIPADKPKGWDVGDAIKDGWGLDQVRAFIKAQVRDTWEPVAYREPPVAGPVPDASRATRPSPKPSRPKPSMPPPAAGGNTKPEFRIQAGALELAVDAGEEALIAADIGIYQRAGSIVRTGYLPVSVEEETFDILRIIEVNKDNMLEIFTRVVGWKKFDARSDDYVPTDCTPKIASSYIGRRGDWKLPVLAGIIVAPTLRRDGSILDQPGYDARTGVLFDPCGIDWPQIPERPTRDDALEAMDILRQLVSTFDFVATGPDLFPGRSVAISAILTALVRRSLPTAPLHAFDASTAGSGKGKLIDIATLIATGRPVAKLTMGREIDETEKRLAGCLLAGDPIIILDNVEVPIGGDLLCSTMTQKTAQLRPLGGSVMKTIPTNALFLASGNNLVIAGDMTRRTLVCRLEPNCEDPERRTFDFEPCELIRNNRARYVIAALTILRAYSITSDRIKLRPLGSFEDWSTFVREPLVWLGECDPCATMEAGKAADPKASALRAVLEQWFENCGNKAKTVNEIISIAAEQKTWNGGGDLRPEFREAMLAVAGSGGTISGKRLGQYLLKNKGRIINDLKIVAEERQAGNVAGWSVQRHGQ